MNTASLEHSGVDLAAWLPAAEAIHQRHLALDIHSDTPMDYLRKRQAGEREVFARRHLPKMQAGGLHGEVVAVYSDAGQLGPQITRAALEAVDAVYAEVAESPDKLAVALKAEEMIAAKQAGQHSLVLGLEGASALQGSLELLRTFYRLGLRWLGLTWNFRNELADGCGEAISRGGLTTIGRRVVEACNKLGVMLDVSHLAEPGVDDVLALADGPVIASHANARAVTNHIRNLTDRHLDGIAKSGGVVGVVFFCDFVFADARSANLSHVLDHVDYLKRRIGIDHIAIGPDYTDYHIDVFNTANSPMQTAGVYSGVMTCARGLDTAREYKHLTAGLLGRGYSEAEIAKFLSGNYLRVMRSVAG